MFNSRFGNCFQSSMFCTTVLLVCECAYAETALRVLGGRDALPGELPYVVRVERKLVRGSEVIMKSACTGTVISPTWVLTAAHCIREGFELVIRHGSIHNPPDAVDTFTSVVESFRHPRFTKIVQCVENDIGLLKTEYLKLQQYGRLSSVPYLSLIGLEAVSAGYGLMNTSFGLQTTFDVKKPLQILQVLLKKCTVDTNAGFPSLCLSPLCGKKNYLSLGDSGGPTLHSTGVVGVCSTGYDESVLPETEKSYHIGQLTAVSPHLDWILSHVRRYNGSDRMLPNVYN